MRRIFQIILIAVIPFSTEAQQIGPAGDPQKGQALFNRYGCYQCHGYEGQGGNAGKRLAPAPMPFAFISAYVRNPTGQMPPYTNKVVTDEELADIYAFLLKIEQPPPLESITILNYQ